MYSLRTTIVQVVGKSRVLILGGGGGSDAAMEKSHPKVALWMTVNGQEPTYYRQRKTAPKGGSLK